MKSNVLKQYKERVNSIDWNARHQSPQMRNGTFAQQNDRSSEGDRQNLNEDYQQGRQGGQSDHTRQNQQGQQNERSRQQSFSHNQRGETLAAVA